MLLLLLLVSTRVPTSFKMHDDDDGRESNSPRDHSIKQMLRPKTTFSLREKCLLHSRYRCCRRTQNDEKMHVWLTKDGLDTIRWVCWWAGHHIGSDRIKSSKLYVCFTKPPQHHRPTAMDGHGWPPKPSTHSEESTEGKRYRDSSSLAANHMGGGLPFKQKSWQAAGVNAEAWTFLPFPTDPSIM